MPSLLERLLGEESTDEEVDLQAREDEAHETLQDRVDPETYGIDDCAVTGAAVVNEGPDEQPIVVPIARFSLGEDVESPDFDKSWQLAAQAIEALVPAFDDVYVRHYDVQFTFDGDGLFEAANCRRIAVSTDIAERLTGELGFSEFRAAMEAADDIDDDIAPVVWSECCDYSQANAAVVTGGAAAAAGASASAASCAGAGAAGGAGGC